MIAPGFTIDVRLETDMLTGFAIDLSPEQCKKAVKRAINYATGRTRTQMKREITSVYTMSSSQANESALKQKMASDRTLSGGVMANASPESLGHFKIVGYAATGAGTVRTARRGKSYGQKTSARKSSKSGVFVTVVKGRTENIHNAFVMLSPKKGGNVGGLVMARGKYAGSNGFKFGKARLPLTKLNSKSVYWGVLHPKTMSRWEPQTQRWYVDELIRQLQGAIHYGK